MKSSLLETIDKNDVYIFGIPNNIKNLEIDENSFRVIRVTDKFLLCKSKIKKSYRPFLSLNEALESYHDKKISLRYFSGNILAYIDEKELADDVKTSNELYFVFGKNKELFYCSIGLPIKPNKLYYYRELDGIITTVKKFHTLRGAYRLEINYENNSLDKYDDFIF